MKRLLLALAIAVSLVAGCADGLDEFFSGSNCNDAIEDYVATYGNPEEINKYDSGGYHSHSYSWYCKGIIVTFTWGENVEDCEVSTYTFSPIC